MTQTPTDALRLVPRRAVYDWLRDDVPLNVKMTVMPHHIDALMDRLSKAAPASPLPGGGWQDISTAPKDGTHFLWCRLDDMDGNAGMHVVFWDHGEFRYASDHEKFVGDPVDSWMPLPAAPTGEPK